MFVFYYSGSSRIDACQMSDNANCGIHNVTKCHVKVSHSAYRSSGNKRKATFNETLRGVLITSETH